MRSFLESDDSFGQSVFLLSKVTPQSNSEAIALYVQLVPGTFELFCSFETLPQRFHFGFQPAQFSLQLEELFESTMALENAKDFATPLVELCFLTVTKLDTKFGSFEFAGQIVLAIAHHRVVKAFYVFITAFN